ncbi:MAG TPA: HAMP domain-containing protein, partial [Candidatus Limnocylindria bacterium]|nr:HAMP domain-containing protein [Candidatus Limnocylindria bacterium]
MTFSVRVALLTALAVAVAAVGAAILMYFVVQNQFVAQIDQSLSEAARSARQSGPRPGPRPFGDDPGRMAGRADVFAQSIDASGNILRADLNQPAKALVTAQAMAIAASQHGDAWFDVIAADGEHVRVYVVPLGGNAALEVARSVDEIDEALAETRVRLALVALGGVLLAGALGAVVARTALRPVRRLTNIVEDVARTRDLSQRVATSSNDELGRLAASFNVMLGELETSLRQQRQLVADASHELRTPLTSLRTNLELLERGQPVDPAERQQVLADLVGQM